MLRAMEAELNRQLAWGRDALTARSAVQDVLVALPPALPLPMMAEAVAVPNAEGLVQRASCEAERCADDAPIR